MFNLKTAIAATLTLTLAASAVAGPKPQHGTANISVLRAPDAGIKRIGMPDLRPTPYYGAGSSGVAGTGFCGPLVGGEIQHLKMKVRNLGNAPAAASQAEIIYSRPNGPKLVKTYPVPALPAGGTHVINAAIPQDVWHDIGAPYQGTGTMMHSTFKIEADSHGDVAEKNENNFTGGTCTFVAQD